MNFFKRKKRILVIEDEIDLAESLKARLAFENFDVETAGDGEAGVKKASEFRPNLIILDVMMPKMNGVVACQILKREDRTKDIPILVLTALPGIGDAESAFGAGADG